MNRFYKKSWKMKRVYLAKLNKLGLHFREVQEQIIGEWLDEIRK